MFTILSGSSTSSVEYRVRSVHCSWALSAEWNQRILKRLKRGQKCPHRLILSFPSQSAKGRAGGVKAGRCCYLRRCFGGVPFALSEELGNSHHRPSRLARVLITFSCLLLFLLVVQVAIKIGYQFSSVCHY